MFVTIWIVASEAGNQGHKETLVNCLALKQC